MRQKVILIILDGWGYAPAWGGNAVEMAETPNMDNYWRKYSHTILKAAEEAVGLPYHEPGNSEVGHLNIGSGLVVRQNLPGISKEIKEGTFFKNQFLLDAVSRARQNSARIHLLGLVSDGGVHSHITHLFALLDFLRKENFQGEVCIHVITDGRDTDPMKALSYLSELEAKLKKVKIGRIASVMGRYYAMDRDNRWERIQKAYDLLTLGVGAKAESVNKAISASYRTGAYDEFIAPTAIENSEEKFSPVQEGDSLILFNFRSDRIKELTWAFVLKNFEEFERQKIFKNLYLATFAFHEEYEEKLPVKVVFRPTTTLNPLAEVIARNDLKQFHIAETEKYAHVTYFFNGGREKPFQGEERLLVPSPKVKTYDLKPEMSAERVTEEVLKKHPSFDFTIVNFANPDMVGHSGDLKATIRACEFVDTCLGKVVSSSLEQKMVVLITADHGNAEQMINPNTGEPHTEHTINPVPLIILSDEPAYQNELRPDGHALQDIAPTILKIMNLPVPKEMTGRSLVG